MSAAATTPRPTPLAGQQCSGCLRRIDARDLRPCDCGARLCAECAGYWGSHDHRPADAKEAAA